MESSPFDRASGSGGPDTESPVAIVTGGTGALGRSVVLEFLSRGYRVRVPWYSENELADLAEATVGFEARLTAEPVDVTDPDQVAALFQRVDEGEGRLDALCNLVGGFSMSPIEDTDPAEWRRMMDLNATSAFLCTRSAIGPMRAGGGGAVVNVASVPVLERGGAGMAAYGAAKAALVGMTRALAKELRKDRIRVNAVAPEIIDTAANRAAMPDADRSHWSSPGDVARVIAFLAGEDGRCVTGSVLTVRG